MFVGSLCLPKCVSIWDLAGFGLGGGRKFFFLLGMYVCVRFCSFSARFFLYWVLSREEEDGVGRIEPVNNNMMSRCFSFGCCVHRELLCMNLFGGG